MTTLEGERCRGVVNAALITSTTGAESPELSPWATGYIPKFIQGAGRRQRNESPGAYSSK